MVIRNEEINQRIFEETGKLKINSVHKFIKNY